MRHKELSAWLEWLETLHPEEIELGLERVGSVLNTLKLPAPFCYKPRNNNTSELTAIDGVVGDLADILQQKRRPLVITVAGTNGKGSAVRSLEVLLLHFGLSVACYTSPHLLRYNERVRVNGQDVSDALLCQAFAAVDEARGATSLTYFEFGTLAALKIFADHGVDVVVLEVGLGGRLDAVNCVNADLAVICSIDIDHQSWLGSDRETIAVEKAGILRPGITVICSDRQPPASLLGIAGQLKTRLYCIDHDFACHSDAEQRHAWQGRNSLNQEIQFENLPAFALPAESVAAALQAVALLGIEPGEQDVREALSGLQLAGRFQRETLDGVEFIFDVAHNPAASQRLAENLSRGKSQLSPAARRVAVFAVMRDKDVTAIIQPLSTVFEHWFLGDLAIPRALPAEQLVQQLGQAGVDAATVSGNIRDALSAAMSLCVAGDQVVVFGSFYTVADGLEWLQGRS